MYRYEFWNGKRVIGYYEHKYQIRGTYCPFTYLKKNGQIDSVLVPLGFRTISDVFPDVHQRWVLDVSKLSKKDLTVLKTFMVGGLGFEPRSSDPNSEVLPLDDPPKKETAPRYWGYRSGINLLIPAVCPVLGAYRVRVSNGRTVLSPHLTCALMLQAP
jgi:hypothetical protein